MIEFYVPGKPVPQGGMTAFARGNKVRVVNKSSDQLKNWRALVTLTAAQHFPKPLAGPVCVVVVFSLPRPKSHYGTGRNADVLKASAPSHPTTKPDLDKLVRACLDALSTVAFEDDSQVVSVIARKRYGEASTGISILDSHEVLV